MWLFPWFVVHYVILLKWFPLSPLSMGLILTLTTYQVKYMFDAAPVNKSKIVKQWYVSLNPLWAYDNSLVGQGGLALASLGNQSLHGLPQLQGGIDTITGALKALHFPGLLTTFILYLYIISLFLTSQLVKGYLCVCVWYNHLKVAQIWFLHLEFNLQQCCMKKSMFHFFR